MVAEVAAALGSLKENVVFVGGAVVSLYTDDPAADETRPTDDIDLTINIVSLHHRQEVQEQLAGRDFHPDPFGHSICRYKYKNIPVDIMATKDGPFGPTNRWYEIGFEKLWTAKANDQEIQILSAPCYLATKFEAFANRGKDYRTSHDIEDIITILDNRLDIVSEIKDCDKQIRLFLIKELNKIIVNGMLSEVLTAHLNPVMLEERFFLVKEKINQILSD